ncbi:MAG: hypothetical protein AAFZ92_11170, partial [Pseudomonadota bacterium]
VYAKGQNLQAIEKIVKAAAYDSSIIPFDDIDSIELSTIFDVGELSQEEESALWKRIDNINREIDDNISERQSRDIESEIIISSSISITAGMIGWLFRGGALLTSLLSALPVLRNFDPLPILREKKHKDQDQ